MNTMTPKPECEKCGKEATRIAVGTVHVDIEGLGPTGAGYSIPACDDHELELAAEAQRRVEEQFARDVPKLQARAKIGKRRDALMSELHAMERDYKRSGALDNPNVPSAYAMHKDFTERYKRFKQDWELMERDLTKARET